MLKNDISNGCVAEFRFRENSSVGSPDCSHRSPEVENPWVSDFLCRVVHRKLPRVIRRGESVRRALLSCGARWSGENLAEMHSPEKLDGDYSATADSNVSAELETSISPNGDLQEGNDGENKNIGNSNALANGLSSMLINIIRDFDSKADDTLTSQSQLSSSLDRLTTELDQLLEDAPFPFIMQHASRISNVRKRVLSLNSILRTIQRRVDNIDRAISMGNLPDTRSSQNSSQL